MAIIVAKVGNYKYGLKFPVRKRRDFHIEDDKGNLADYRGIDALLDFDDQAFLDNELVPKFERTVKEQEIRAEEEAKSDLATKEQAAEAAQQDVEDEKQAIDDAVDAGMKAG